MTDSVVLAAPAPAPTAPTPLSPTARTTHKRARHHGVAERAALVDVLQSAKLCHMGVTVGGVPMVFPTAYGFDLDGPDRGGSIYVHGSVASRSLAPDSEICITITILDGLVLARSGFHHSMNYRSGVIVGSPRVVTDNDERVKALDLIVDQVVPGRSQHLRDHTRKEMAATVVLALPLYEASVKARTGGPGDDAADIGVETIWAGVVPVSSQFSQPIPSDDLDSGVEIPEHISTML
ncbi:pyridoxamine 5'-phosphate oxidase family protein [Rhodococcus sp. (in: high G+C Gram-positive bacteria)]|uniref:pyridoxamine 5'-phosphate oxidase family protein n=1 Tax=Rhodococcus sp. TaxID=1831 RepID=UPI001A3534FA|nr:pyridoxamine 5'-phosphate oxidase family protein [Rhodococcus sp. (in: high G+C Gram-positive bacteria)]MBJ7481509.1 pyridoxamine 5'-phosphate oxidase family protein [Rhodococcus sp. (in: high G+C Gram-positive bacteria)]